MQQPIEQEIGVILMRLTRDFQRRLDRDLHARGVRGIGARHRSVFLHLDHHAPCRAVELAAAAGIRPQSMMAAVHELEAMGLVRREPDPRDSRAKLIRFTDAGRRLIEELTISTETVWREYTALTSESELTHTFGNLKRLLALSTARPKADIKSAREADHV